MRNTNQFTRFLAVSGLVVLLAACAMFSGRETPGSYVDDATITSRVKVSIIKEPTLKVLQINVETMEGVVQLSGFVDNEQSKDRAVDIARHVNGVKSVADNMMIVTGDNAAR
jgi:osmotically-inducible protein OsmY